jgi:hexosaminidase
LPEFDPEKGVLMITLKSEFPDAEIRYTIDGSEPGPDSQIYAEPFEMNSSGTVKARAFVKGEMKGNLSERKILLHDAVGKEVSYRDSYDDRYPGGGAYGLVNGLRGSVHYRDGNWQGFSGRDIEVVVDLGKQMNINEIEVAFLQNITSWIFLPAKVIFLYSDSGEESDYEVLTIFENSTPMEEKEARIQDVLWNKGNVSARYVKVIAENPGPCPDWHPGAGGPSWVFMDEVVVK